MSTAELAQGIIISTGLSCRLKGQSWSGVPTLLWEDGVDEAASDWFRVLVVERGVATSSAREYAKTLRPYLRFCRQRGKPWQTADDDFIIMWREHLRRGLGVEAARVNASLKTIFAFYRWAEENKVIRFQVGIYTTDELPESLQHTSFPISAKRSFSKTRHGRVYNGWTTPLTLSEAKKGSHVRHTPTEDEIRELHEVTVERAFGERDSLMLSWAEEAGPRRFEFLQISKAHMPTPAQLADLIERDEPWSITLTRKGRKGGNSSTISALPDLLIRTMDFIDHGRREIVQHCLSTIVGYREPGEVFLSSTTGQVLHPDSVTSIGRRNFTRAGIRGANIHRLRARFAVRTVETLLDAVFDGEEIGSHSNWIETILVKASESMGHASPQSLRPYLTYVLNRRIQTADASKADRLDARLRQLRHYEGTLVRRMSSHSDLHGAARHIEAGRHAEAAKELRRIADSLVER